MRISKHVITDLFQSKNLDYKQDKYNFDYHGFDIIADKKIYKYREGKVTPTKIGFFVTFWLKNQKNINEPYSAIDQFAYIVFCPNADPTLSGYFYFEIKELIKFGLIKTENQKGKMGFRLYPPHIKVLNSQASKTQSEMKNCFHYFKNN